MNKDIHIMIGLQKFWQNILAENKNIERYNHSIEFWNKELSGKKKTKTEIHAHLMDLKNSLKKYELDLQVRDDKIKKLEHKKTIVQTQKELDAVDHELVTVKSEKGEIEELIIDLLDKIETEEKSLATITEEIPVMEKKVAADIEMISKDINKSNETIKQNRDGFDSLLKDLNPSLQGKFNKLLSSKSGIAIAEISGDVCTGCNFVIPPALALEASKSDKAVNCTNCGRYIFKL